ncbi:MAG: cobaltochelatase subunit CobN, partial [Pseudomonadota bacterium]
VGSVRLSSEKKFRPVGRTSARPRIDACGPRELYGLARALDGLYLAPGPAGAPTRGRADVLPTGRNFFSLDSRTLPTPTAWDLGKRSAELVIQRYLQDEGDWPTAIAMSAWGTANMRTGGDDIAQALALMGVQPTWEPASGRVTGYEVIPLGKLGRPRVDVTFRVSGFFRDAFPAQMALIDTAARAVAALDEPRQDNPLAARWRDDQAALIAGGAAPEEANMLAGARVFGSKPGAYGAGLQALLDEGIWETQGDLAEAYVTWGQYIYSGSQHGTPAADALRTRLAATEAILHNQDNREHDLLDSDDYYQFEGGLAASVTAARGQAVPVYHNDHARPERPVVRPLQEEIGRVVRGRAANPKWLAGVMRHGYKGAFEITATLDYLFAFAATTTAVQDHHFDALYDAYIEAQEVRAFMAEANPDALRDLCKRFLEAQDRDLWTPKRNSARSTLTALLAEDGVPIDA